MTGNFAGPEELGTWVRCLSRGMPGAMTPTAYGNNYQIVRSQDHVAVVAEMIHDARVIPLRPQPHIAPSIRQWLGDSRGHWEGDTLVVEVTNLTDKASFRGSTANLHVTERYTRTGPDTLHYEVTLEDAAAWSAPWKFFIDLCTRSRPGPRVRVRVSRGQLRHAKHPERVAGDGRGKQLLRLHK